MFGAQHSEAGGESNGPNRGGRVAARVTAVKEKSDFERKLNRLLGADAAETDLAWALKCANLVEELSEITDEGEGEQDFPKAA